MSMRRKGLRFRNHSGNARCIVPSVQDADVNVIAKLLDEAMVPTAEYVANLEAAMAAATQELATFREEAATRREAESKVSRSCMLKPAGMHVLGNHLHCRIAQDHTRICSLLCGAI
jgi:hypothetical protein